MNHPHFEGWYFKCSLPDYSVALIPACHRSGGRESVSLQIITENGAWSVPFESWRYRRHPLYIALDGCVFSEKGIQLTLHHKVVSVEGALQFSSLSPLRYDIMGPFGLVPYMQCRHSILSMKHSLQGKLRINGKELDFSGGQGYLEGDRGHSFPKSYLWTHCFFKEGALMLSVADIPMTGFCFTGIIGVVLLNGREYRIATYLGARVSQLEKNAVTVKQGGYELSAHLLEKHALPLRAPVAGEMSRIIHESVSCRAYYRFSLKGKPLCEFTSDRASFEFEYPNG